MQAAHPTVQRVLDAGRALGLTLTVVQFPDGTRTAVDAAAAVGCDVGQIVKSLAFAVDGEVVMAYVSGRNQLDESKLAAAAGGSTCERVDARRVRDVTGYAIGGVPPFGHANNLRLFLDRDLLGYDLLWAAAGTPRDVFSISPGELAAATGAVICDLSRDVVAN